MSRRSLSSPQLRSDSSASPAPHSTIQRLSVPGSKPIVFVKAFLMHCIVTIFILIVKGRKKYFPRDSYPSHRFLTFLPTLAPSDGSAATLATAKQGQLFCVSHFSILFYSYYFHSYVSAPTCPFRQPDGCHLPRQAGTALGSYSFLFKQKVIYCLSKTHFTPAVILERRAILE